MHTVKHMLPPNDCKRDAEEDEEGVLDQLAKTPQRVLKRFGTTMSLGYATNLI